MQRKRQKTSQYKRPQKPSRYSLFAKINGTHPYKEAVIDGHVDYSAHVRHGGEIFYFNFNLAKEIGLIEADHPETLNKELTDTLLATFSIEIINEYDLEHNTRFSEKEIKPDKYMATRYLQLQHPNKQGSTSGDGRSIWNGCVKKGGIIWDISSCGTGATSLSPATAIEDKYFKTGDKKVCYGCGRAELQEGLAAAINSAVFHNNGINTERTLAIIKYRGGTSVNVRAAKNLLRPAHIFRYLKRNDYDGLKSIVDYYINRQISNKFWPKNITDKNKYQYLLTEVTNNFSRLAAKLETEYVFCWLDWDGDNILMDGGIIDFGSIRQFGLFHSEYRYDDYERLSTSIVGQKHQAKYIVQTFAQIVDFLTSGKKKNIKTFRSHPSLKKFDKLFGQHKDKSLLYKIGFDRSLIDELYDSHGFMKSLFNFTKTFTYFEHQQSSFGIYEVADGITSDAVFCMRDLLRELPGLYLQEDHVINYDDFISIIKSEYARDDDIGLYPSRKRKIQLFQKYYKELITLAANHRKCTEKTILKKIALRSEIINRYERVTGDAIIAVTRKMGKANAELGTNEMYRILRNFIEEETLVPELSNKNVSHAKPLKKPQSKKALQSMLRIVKNARSGI